MILIWDQKQYEPPQYALYLYVKLHHNLGNLSITPCDQNLLVSLILFFEKLLLYTKNTLNQMLPIDTQDPLLFQE
jgi:hypothetical protein